MARKIVTHHSYPPIPVRSFDWCAFYDGCEEDGRYGYGATEAEAVADFIENCAPDYDDEAARSSVEGSEMERAA